MAHKIYLRATEFQRRRKDQGVREWCAKHVEDVETFAEELDPSLWAEAKRFAAAFESEAKPKLSALRIPIPLGGGGHYPLLYFLARLTKPNTAIETGVGAGFSTKAILVALARNGFGRLYSSDFPIFRLQNPEKYIGCLVDEDLKKSWELHIAGDRQNLRKILARIDKVDLFHYDSDKRYLARKYVMENIGSRFTRDTVMVMDDIQDNFFFRDYSEGRNFRVFECLGKYAGVIGV